MSPSVCLLQELEDLHEHRYPLDNDYEVFLHPWPLDGVVTHLSGECSAPGEELGSTQERDG